MVSQFNIDNVTHGVSGWGNILSDTIYTVVLGAASDTTLTVPSSTSLGFGGANINKFIARIRIDTHTKSVWFAMNTTAAVPSGAGAFAASSSELLMPDNGYYVRAADVLHFISAAAADISVAFYAIQSN